MTPVRVEPADEVRNLQRVLNDLIGVMALPALWSGRGSAEIVGALLDGVMKTLRLDFGYARVTAPFDGSPAEVFRTSQPGGTAIPLEVIGQHLLGLLRNHKPGQRQRVVSPVGEGQSSIAFFPLGLLDGIGVVVVGSERPDFPTKIEELVLQVAANQATLGLQEARRLAEQQRAAKDLELRVAERTRQLSTVNEELRDEIAQRRALKDELASELVEMNRLHDLTMRLQTSTRLLSVLDQALAATIDLQGADFGLVQLRNPQSGALEIVAHRGFSRDFLDRFASMSDEENSACGRAMARAERVIIENVETDAGFAPLRAIAASEGFRAVQSTPLIDRAGEMLGVISTQFRRPHRPTDVQLRFTDLYARQATDMVERNRAEENMLGLKDELAAELAEMTRLHQLATRMQEGTDMQSLLEEVLDATMALQHADFGSVRVYNAEAQTYDLIAQRGFGPEYHERFNSVPSGSVVYSAALLRGERVVVADFEKDERITSMRDDAASMGVRAVQVTPLFCDAGEMMGLIATHFRAPHRPSQREVRFSDLYARHAGNLIERRRAAGALQRSEALLTEGEKISHTGSWRIKPRTGEVWWSPEHYRIFGLDPDTARVTQAAGVSMIHPADLPQAVEQWERAVRERSVYDSEFRMVRPDGTVRHCHSIGHPVLEASGEVVEIVGTIIDITERKAADEALLKAREDLAHVARVTTMGELTASIAHEVNQPLAAVVTNANACVHWLNARPANTEEAKAASQRIIRDANRASQVITHIRAFLTRGRFLKEPIRIEDVIEDVAGFVQGEARTKGVALTVSLAPGLPRVLGDRVQLQQVLLNLMVNAIEAMAAVNDRPRELQVDAQAHGASQVLVRVRDTGPGLDAKQVDCIFDTFYTTKPGGMGMGLPISRSIVEGHGGLLWATLNEEARGGMFQFTLPTAEAGPA